MRSPTVRAAAGRDGHPAPYSGVPNARRDLETVKRVGLEHYRETLGKKMEGLRFLLERCNDGRRKSLFCTAVNLLELEDVEAVIARLED